MKIWKKCPLILLLILSGCLLAAAGYAGEDSIYHDYKDTDLIASGIQTVFRGWKDGVFPWILLDQEEVQTVGLTEEEQQLIAEEVQDIEDEPLHPEETEGVKETESAESGELIVPAESHGPQYDKFGVLISDEVVSHEGTKPEENIPEEPEIIEMEIIGETDSAGVSANEVPEAEFPSMEEVVEESRTYEFCAVGEEYFDDALFIGDSRTVGMASYAGFSESTDFYAATSTTIHQIFEQPKKIAVLDDGRKVTVEEALKEKQYGKIYIMLGINELGRGTTGSFFTSYAETVNQIRLLQPNAIIFVQGIMRVSTEKSNTDTLYRNETINERNQALSMMENNQDIFYLEVNDAVCDETGGLVSEYTFDQVHLKAKYYQLWKNYLLAHGVVRD